MILEFLKEVKAIFNSDHPLYLIFTDIWNLLLSFWNYKIYITAEQQQILVSNVIISIILFLFGIKLVRNLTKVIKRKLSHRIDEVGTVNSLSQLAYYFLMLVMTLFVLDLAKVPLTIFAVVGTTLALGIGLGSQNIVNNFISGIIIMIEQPVKVGDIIEVKNITGEVTHIGARCTSVKTSKNINILIPNSSILQDMVINWTLEDTILKQNIIFCIKNNIEIDKLEDIILHIFAKFKFVLKTPVPVISLVDFNSNDFEIDVSYYIDISDELKSSTIVNLLNRALLEEFKLNKIIVLSKVNCSCVTHSKSLFVNTHKNHNFSKNFYFG